MEVAKLGTNHDMITGFNAAQLKVQFLYFSFPAPASIAGNPPSDIFLFLQADIAARQSIAYEN